RAIARCACRPCRPATGNELARPCPRDWSDHDLPQRRLGRRQQDCRLVRLASRRRSVVCYDQSRARASLGALLAVAPMRLSKDAWFRIELVFTAAMVALGLGSVLYTMSSYLGAAWRWAVG